MTTPTPQERLSDSEHELRALITLVATENRPEPAAHDLRNALSVIGTYRDLMNDPDCDDAELRIDIENAIAYAAATIARLTGLAAPRGCVAT